jgi:hypothetical protein
MAILCGLAGLALVLFGVACVGHLLWLAGAAVFGAASAPPAVDRCPGCATLLNSGQVKCAKCGYPVFARGRATLDDELAATRRQLHRLLVTGKISSSAWEQLTEALRADVREREYGAAPPERELEIIEPADSADPLEKAAEAPLAAASPVEVASSSTPVPTPAQAFVAHAPLPSEPVPLPADRLPREPEGPRGWSGILQAFMEEKNIRWGELIAGLLIVLSSVGLVRSLWATLKEAIPYFPVAVFLVATAAMHGAGLYTLRRWRLKSTSRALLVISTLLVPLNVLAAMVLNEKKSAYELIDYVAFAIGLSVLSVIAASSARVLNRRNPWPLILAVVGTAIGMSTIGRLARPGGEMGRTLGIFALPFFSFLVAAIAHVVSLSEGRRLTVRRVAQSFRFYGIATFGLVLAGGLLASKCGDIRGTLALLSPMLAAVAATLAGAGLIVHQRVTDPEQVGFRIAGTSIAIGGGLLAVVALALAWPRPDLLVAVGLLDAVAFTLLAWFAAFPALNVFATISCSLAVLVGWEWATDEISVVGATSELLTMLLLTARSALIVALLSLAADVAGCVLVAFKKRPQASAYFMSSAVHQVVAVAIAIGAVVRDLPDQDLATAVFTLVAIRWLVATWSIKRSYASWIAASALFAAIVHGLVLNDRLSELLAAHGLAPTGPWKMSLLLHATICLGCAAIGRRARRADPSSADQPERALVSPFLWAAIATSALAVPLVLDLRHGHFLAHGVYAFWTAAIWFAIAFLRGSTGLAVASQALATIGVAFAVTGVCRRQPWWTDEFTDPLFLNWQFGVLAVWSASWMLLRRLGQRVAPLARILKSEPTSVDRVVLAAVTLGLAMTCWLAAWPGTMAELSSVTSRAVGKPYLAMVLVPFGVGAVLAAAHALFAQQWKKTTAYVIGACLISVMIFAAPLQVQWHWPGLPSPYGEGWGAGAWAALVIALVAVIAAHWERPNRATLTGIALLLGAVPYLIACRWDADLQTATALRWATASAGLVVAAAWGVGRSLIPVLGQPGVSQPDGQTPDAAPTSHLFLRNSLIVATSLPVLLLTSQALIDVLGTGRIPLAPGTGSLLVRLAPYLSYSVPLGILAAAFVIFAIADRHVLWGLAATFLVQLALGIAAALSLILYSDLPMFREITRYLQEMGVLTVIAAALWCGIEAWARRRRALELRRAELKTPIRAQLGFVAVLAGLLTAGATTGLWLSPEPLVNSVREYGTPLGWLFIASAAAVFVWSRRGSWPLSAVNIGLLFLSAAAVLGAASLDHWNSATNWLSPHAAMAGWSAVLALAAVATLVFRSPERRAGAVAIADRASLLLPLVLLFAGKAELLDPQRPWWTAGVVIWLALCVTVLAVGAESRLRSYLSLLLALLGAISIGLRPWLVDESPPSQAVGDFANIVMLGLGLHGLVWLTIELFYERRRQRTFDVTSEMLKVHHSAAVVGTFLLGFSVLALASLFAKTHLPGLPIATPLGWSALGVLALLAAGSLWEQRAEHPLPVLYALGLIAIVTVLDWRQLEGRDWIFASVASLAGYVALSGGLWTVRRPLKQIGLRLGMSPFATDRERATSWLGPTSLAIGALVIGVEFWVVLTFQHPTLRIGGALATLAVGGGLALLATTRARDIVQATALGVGAIAAVQFGWGLMDPLGSAAHEELRRTIRMMAMLAATTFVYSLPLARLIPPANSWFASIRRASIGVAAAAISTLALVLLFEIWAFDPTLGAPVTVGESLLVASTLVLLAAGLVSLAVLPGRDPFLHVERQRFLYVYASEAVCGLLFAHVYLTNPQFFRHTLQPYWPLVVMAIAYAGTAVSEGFRRWKIKVLAEPLEYSAAFLPLLPVVGFWFLSSDLNYSTMLVVVGLLYLFLSLRRGSFVYAAAAAVVGNATLCSLFSEHGVSLLLHPQMFVIPPCLTILAAAQLNRDRLDEKVLASLRYFAITTIYVSSTGEMFQHGIGTTLWLPMVLAGLSVLGVLAGIMLRVRAFLYLGTSFLLLSVVSMVWHAARSIGHVWPWWVFLFALGVGLLSLFGVFEKKRPEVLALVGSLREWES